jgi:hypothetical protein
MIQTKRAVTLDSVMLLLQQMDMRLQVIERAAFKETPNDTTIAAMQEALSAENDPAVPAYKTTDALFKDLNALCTN